MGLRLASICSSKRQPGVCTACVLRMQCAGSVPHSFPVLIPVCFIQSVATFTAVGPTLNGKTVYENCIANVKSGVSVAT